MKMQGLMAAIAAATPLLSAEAVAQQTSVRAGDEYIITKSYQNSQEASDGSSSGNSNGREDLLERVIAVRDDSLELEYDLPKEATSEERARNWQFPARVLKPADGPMQLLNGAAMEARVDQWLKLAGWTREVCGRWIFTWNASRIECEPNSVIQTIEEIDLRSLVLRDGAQYSDLEALVPGILKRKELAANRAVYTVLLDINPEAVRKARAASDVAVGEIVRKPVTLEAALQNRRSESISGSISLTFDINPDGTVWRRTKVTKLVTNGRDGGSESQMATEVVERRPAAAP